MVRSFNMKTMRPATRTAAQCRFGYRTSIFKQRPGEIIISATLRMKKGNSKKISTASAKDKAWRMAHHPLEHPSAGSVFKNVPLVEYCRPQSKTYRDAVRKLSIQYRGSTFSVKTDPVPVIAAAKLIGESGLAGKCSGWRNDIFETHELHRERPPCKSQGYSFFDSPGKRAGLPKIRHSA